MNRSAPIAMLAAIGLLGPEAALAGFLARLKAQNAKSKGKTPAAK
jgi:hypothetical protein